jgi:threonine dehydratase
MIPFTWIEQASQRIAGHIRKTPLTYDADLDLYIKWENHQLTGSFKVRGAFNRILSLKPWELEGGLVAASAGNHGQGVALAGKMAHAVVTIFCSEHAVPLKIKAMQALGAEVRLIEGGYEEAEQAGIAYAKARGAKWISPYNDGQIIAGQGTLGLEILEQLPSLPEATLIVPAGGGGLASGIGAAIKPAGALHQSTLVQKAGTIGNVGSPGKISLIAVQSEASPFLHALYYRGSQENINELPSLADGLAGPVERGSLTIPLVKQLVDRFVLVSETEIAQAIAFAWRQYHEIIEGSAATTLAAVLSGKINNHPAVAVISGGNIQPEVHARIVSADRTL